MDVTELLPHPDNKAPDLLTAKLIYRTLSMIFERWAFSFSGPIADAWRV